MTEIDYGEAILKGFEYLLQSYEEVFVMGQGLWSPWYVGNSMTNLELKFGKNRVIDTPISELVCTGAAVGASLCGYRPIIVHPRMDFMLYAIDPIVNQAAKWSHMFGGQAHPSVTVRGIINRGGQQGAQHSQALHSWFAHIPGLRVVMPASVSDARDLLIASVLSPDPVLYIDDRWLYDRKDVLDDVVEIDLSKEGPRRIREGSDITLVGSSFSTFLCEQVADRMREEEDVLCDVIDMRVINPMHNSLVVASVLKTGRLCVVDGSWASCGLAGEIIAGVMESIDPIVLKAKPRRVTLPPTPAPTSKTLEENYYPDIDIISNIAKIVLNDSYAEKNL